MEQIEPTQIQAFLEELGRRYSDSATLLLLGGSALCLLGSPRPTLDIDYVGDDLEKNELQRTIDQVAFEMQIDVEPVPIAEFMPLPAGAEERRLYVGQFGQIQVYIFDPYTVALSKIDRGFDTDIEDVLFLIRQRLITLERLEEFTLIALKQAHEFDLIPSEMQAHLEEVRTQLYSG